MQDNHIPNSTSESRGHFPPDFDASVLGDVHVMDRRVMPDGTFECEIVVTPPGHLSQRFIGEGASRVTAFVYAVRQAKEWLEAQT